MADIPTVVLDTNVLLVSISSRSPHHWLYEALVDERFALLVTSAILLEYEEVIGEHMGSDVAASIGAFLAIAPNVEYVTRYYRWHLVVADPDNDKFVDCAIAGRADAVVTHDRHFDVVRDLAFPTVHIVTLDQFRVMLDGWPNAS